MSEEFQKTLFEPFTREEKSGTNKVQGTGLGTVSYTHLYAPMRKLHGPLSTVILPQHLPNRMKHTDFYTISQM